MFFKNLIAYQITEELKLTAELLELKLNEHTFTPCKSQELSRYGWINPCLENDDVLAYPAKGVIMIAAQKEEKIIPPAVIKNGVTEKVAVIEREQARNVYRKERGQLKDEVVLDLLPRAFSKYQKTYALIVPESNWIFVDASSHKRAEELLSHLRGTLGSLPICLPDVTSSPSAVMSHWLEEPTSVPEGFEALDNCKFVDNVLEGGQVAVKGQQLDDEEYKAHLEAGKRVVELAIEWQEQFRLKLKDDLRITNLKATEQLQERLADESAEDAIAQFESDLFRMGAEYPRLLNDIINSFGGLAPKA